MFDASGPAHASSTSPLSLLVLCAACGGAACCLWRRCLLPVAALPAAVAALSAAGGGAVSHNWFAQLFRKCVAQLFLRTVSRNSSSISHCNFVVFVMCLLCGPSSFVELLFCLTRSALCMHCRFLRCYFVLVVFCFLCGLSSSVKLLVCLTRPALCMHGRLLL